MAERSKVPIYMKAPMTARTGALFAHRLGFKSVSNFANSLPEGARVLDVGAGRSPLGKNVCYEREDIEWTNVDIKYFIPGMIDRVSRFKPLNLRFVPADVLHLDEVFPEERFDRVYSYWLLPHMSMAGSDVASEAARNMLAVADSLGKVTVGPCRSRMPGVTNKLLTTDMIGLGSRDLDEIAADMANATRFTAIERTTQYLANQVFNRLGKDEAVLPEYIVRPS